MYSVFRVFGFFLYSAYSACIHTRFPSIRHARRRRGKFILRFFIWVNSHVNKNKFILRFVTWVNSHVNKNKVAGQRRRPKGRASPAPAESDNVFCCGNSHNGVKVEALQFHTICT